MKIRHYLSRLKAEGIYKLETARLHQYQKRKKTVEVVPEKRCSGCGGCKNICPVDAIALEENEFGYLLPIVDKEKCINCGLCLKRCPGVEKSLHNSMEEAKVYAVWAEDEVRKKSSSGGMFTLLAEWVLDQNGTVFGASFDEHLEVVHIGIDYPFVHLQSVYLLLHSSPPIRDGYSNNDFAHLGIHCRQYGISMFVA